MRPRRPNRRLDRNGLFGLQVSPAACTFVCDRHCFHSRLWVMVPEASTEAGIHNLRLPAEDFNCVYHPVRGPVGSRARRVMAGQREASSIG